MAITNAEARDKWMGPVRDAYASALVFRMLTNREFEGDAANAYELELHTTTASFSPTKTDRETTRNPNLPAAETTDDVSDTLKMRYRTQESIYERSSDILEGPSDILPVAMREVAYEVAKAADDQVRSLILAGVTDAKDGENTAGLRYGGAGVYIDSSGNAKGDGAIKFFAQIMRRINHEYRANDYWKMGDPSFDSRQPFAITDAAMATSMLEYIDEEKPSDELVNSYTRSDGIEVGGMFGVWKNVPIESTNRLPLLEVGGVNYHQVLVTNPAAVTAAYRDPEIEFDQGSVIVDLAGTLTRMFGWTMDIETTYGCIVLGAPNNGLLYRFLVRAQT